VKIVTLICDVCHQPIIGTGCAPHMTHVLDDDSANNVHYHAECCPDCIAEENDADNEQWQAFLLNELHAENAERLGL
jgi:hypothetical protein